MKKNKPTTNAKVWINGITGRMGTILSQEIGQTEELQLVGGSDHDGHYLYNQESRTLEASTKAFEDIFGADLVIDFSNIDGNSNLLSILSKLPNQIRRPKVLIATTGLEKTIRDQWQVYGQKHGVLFAPNTSLGVLITMIMSRQIAKILRQSDFDIELIESHHKNKKDAPSGTAIMLANSIAKQNDLKVTTRSGGERQSDELGVAYVRGGAVFGHHEVMFLGDDEEIRISHTALNRRLFAKGAIKLAKVLWDKSPGNYYIEHFSVSDL